MDHLELCEARIDYLLIDTRPVARDLGRPEVSNLSAAI